MTNFSTLIMVVVNLLRFQLLSLKVLDMFKMEFSKITPTNYECDYNACTSENSTVWISLRKLERRLNAVLTKHFGFWFIFWRTWSTNSFFLVCTLPVLGFDSAIPSPLLHSYLCPIGDITYLKVLLYTAPDTPTAKARWVLMYIHFQIYSKAYKTNEFS